MGIVRYNRELMDDDASKRADPLSEPPLYDIACADEPYDKLIPWRPWTIGNPSNIGK